jgi:hypothetical protein
VDHLVVDAMVVVVVVVVVVFAGEEAAAKNDARVVKTVVSVPALVLEASQ